MSGECGEPTPARLVVASYNVHGCVGRDGRHDPERVAAVIRELGADVVALQEVDSRPGIERGIDQFEFLARATGLEVVPGPTLRAHRGEYGNALLTRFAPTRVERVDLSVAGREPRGALDVELRARGSRVRLIATHLGLRARERRAQVRRLLGRIEDRDADALVLLGDMNEWWPAGMTVRRIQARLGRAPAPRTFPTGRALFALDRIWVRPATALASLRVHRTPSSREASDHWPLRAELRLQP